MEYPLKIITALFTKASICASILETKQKIFPVHDPAHTNLYYIETLLIILRDTYIKVNNEFMRQKQLFEDLKDNKGKYFHTGGNLYVIIAGVLLYINQSFVIEGSILESIRTKIKKEIPELLKKLEKMFNSLPFVQYIHYILSSVSDIDMTFLSNEQLGFEDIKTKKLNT